MDLHYSRNVVIQILRPYGTMIKIADKRGFNSSSHEFNARNGNIAKLLIGIFNDRIIKFIVFFSERWLLLCKHLLLFAVKFRRQLSFIVCCIVHFNNIDKIKFFVFQMLLILVSLIWYFFQYAFTQHWPIGVAVINAANIISSSRSISPDKLVRYCIVYWLLTTWKRFILKFLLKNEEIYIY